MMIDTARLDATPCNADTVNDVMKAFLRALGVSDEFEPDTSRWYTLVPADEAATLGLPDDEVYYQDFSFFCKDLQTDFFPSRRI